MLFKLQASIRRGMTLFHTFHCHCCVCRAYWLVFGSTILAPNHPSQPSFVIFWTYNFTLSNTICFSLAPLSFSFPFALHPSQKPYPQDPHQRSHCKYTESWQAHRPSTEIYLRNSGVELASSPTRSPSASLQNRLLRPLWWLRLLLRRAWLHLCPLELHHLLWHCLLLHLLCLLLRRRPSLLTMVVMWIESLDLSFLMVSLLVS